MANVTFTWLGHGSYRLDSPGGPRIYVDPWLDNPKFPDAERPLEQVDVLAITHGHGDHVGSAVEICKQHSPKVVAIFELAVWLESKGAEGASALGMNKGGTVEVDGVMFTMTHARHSGGLDDENGITYLGDAETARHSGGLDDENGITYLGDAAGYVIEFGNGLKVYAAGDTDVFGDMELIGRLYSPDVAILPIGDQFTMGPKQAALALELVGSKRCVPVHWGTFGLLTGTPDALRELAPGVEVLDAEPGVTIEL